MATDDEVGSESVNDHMEDIVDGWNTMYRRIEKLRVNVAMLKSVLRSKSGMTDDEIARQIDVMGGYKEEL